MDNKVKISVKLDPKVKIDLNQFVKDNGSNINRFMNSLIENTIYNTDKNNTTIYSENLYREKLAPLMINHMEAISTMEDCKLRTELQKEVEEMLCLFL